METFLEVSKAVKRCMVGSPNADERKVLKCSLVSIVLDYKISGNERMYKHCIETW